MPKTNGATQLRAYLEKKKYNQREASALLETHWTTINQILSGRRKPGLKIAVRIQRATGIAVDSWSTPAEMIADEQRRLKNRRKAAKLKRAAAKLAASAPVRADTSTAMDESAVAEEAGSDERGIDSQATTGGHIPVVDVQGDGGVSPQEQ